MGDFSLIASLLPSNNCNKSRISSTYELVTKLIVGENISLFIYHDANLFYNFSSALLLRVRYTFSLKEVNWGRPLIDIHILKPNSQKNWYSTLWLNHLDVLTRQAQMINIFKSGHSYCTVYVIRKHFCNFQSLFHSFPSNHEKATFGKGIKSNTYSIRPLSTIPLLIQLSKYKQQSIDTPHSTVHKESFHI